MNNSSIVVVSAPQGAGKSRHAERLREMFGCRCIVDDWDGRSDVPDGALVLTNMPMGVQEESGDGIA